MLYINQQPSGGSRFALQKSQERCNHKIKSNIQEMLKWVNMGFQKNSLVEQRVEMGMGKDLTPNLGRSWPSCPWGSQKNMRCVCDREGDLVSLVILHIYEGNLHILLVPIVCPSTGFPKVGLPELGPKRPSVARWQKWTTSRAHGLSPWEAPVSGNSFFVCLCCPFCL